jgi:hypothetical protein
MEMFLSNAVLSKWGEEGKANDTTSCSKVMLCT